MIIVSGLTVSRGERVLFQDFDLRLSAGEAVALTGANGAGKTSLLRAVAGFLQPDCGSITFPENDPHEVRAGRMHWLGHLDGLKGSRRAQEELAFQAAWAGADRSGLAAAVERLSLEPLMHLEVRQLSAGQRRRLAFARLIAAPRPIWLLDEPFAPLDANWRTVVGTLMQSHLMSGGAILAAVHDPLPIATRSVTLGTLP